MLSDKELKDLAAEYVFYRGIAIPTVSHVVEFGFGYNLEISFEDARKVTHLLRDSKVIVKFSDNDTRDDRSM